MSLFQRCKRGGTMSENIKPIPNEILEALNRCKEAQKERKKRQQQYCIDKYYRDKEEAERNENAKR